MNPQIRSDRCSSVTKRLLEKLEARQTTDPEENTNRKIATAFSILLTGDLKEFEDFVAETKHP